MRTSTLRIALASRRDLFTWEVDDRPLHTALEARGVEVSRPAWDDPEVDWSAFDAVWIRTTWDYVERLDAFRAWATEVASRTTLLNPLPVVLWNLHKSYLRELEEWGIPVVPTVWVERDEQVALATVMGDQGWGRAFLKPAVGASASGTRRVSGPPTAEDQAHLDGLGEALIQPYRDTVESQGEASVVVVAGRAAHGVRKVPVPGDYRVQDDYGATDAAWDAPASARELAEHAVAEVAARLGAAPLVARVDMLTGPYGPEVNELELVEPSLFLRRAPASAEWLAEALVATLGGPPRPRRPAARPAFAAVVFDLDGTILDSTEVVVQAHNAARIELGCAPRSREAIAARIGLPLVEMVAELCDPTDPVEAIAEAYRVRYAALATEVEAPFAGMLELLVDLKVAGCVLAIATGKSQHGALAAAARHRLGHWIDHVHGIVPGTPGKPHPDVLLRALADAGVAPDQAVFVGDTSYDMEVARRAGSRAIGVAWGVHAATALREAGAARVVDDVPALRRALFTQPA